MASNARSLTHDQHRQALAARYAAVRARSLELVAPLSAEDACVQSMPDASPAKWHLAHVTWFFETFVLELHAPAYRPFQPAFRQLFNSYYNGIGVPFPRAQRGLLSRPALPEVLAYRADVDARMAALIAGGPAAVLTLVELGLEHEAQHQELLLMDAKHLLSMHPLAPVYRAPPPRTSSAAAPLAWIEQPGGVVEVGAAGGVFSFDNETPRHRCLLAPYALASRPVTNGDYAAFVADGGYRRPELWLADGWVTRAQQDWQAPAYWRRRDGVWLEFTLGGEEPLDHDAPVCHVSHYEADAYAQWAGVRLATEFEWEAAASALAPAGHFVERGWLHPRAPEHERGKAEAVASGGTKTATGRIDGPAQVDGPALVQLYGDVWEWTRSAYLPYPGFRAAAGAVGEYNGKFMSNQMVLKGGCCVTPSGHVRASYRNFFYPHQRWAFSGIRLARDL